MLHSLRKKILFGYGVVLILTLLVFLWAFINLLHLGQASDNILKRNYKSILATEYMLDALEHQNNATLLTLLGASQEDLQPRFQQYASQFLQWLGKAQDNITEHGEPEVLNAIEQGYTAYLLKVAELQRSASSEALQYYSPPLNTLPLPLPDSGRGWGRSIYHGQVEPNFASVREACLQLREINQNAMFQSSEKARQLAATARWSLMIVGITAIGLGFGFSVLLSTLIVKPLRQMMLAAQRIAAGDYETELAAQSDDELGLLAKEFNTMAAKVKAYHDLNIHQMMMEKTKNETILHDIDDGIIVFNPELHVTNINPKAAHALHVEVERALNQHCLEILKQEFLFTCVKQAAESGQIPIIQEGQNILTVSPRESPEYYEFSVRPLKLANQAATIFGVTVLLRDVTHLKRLEQMKSEFVLAASHELRTPMTSINMCLELLHETMTDRLTEKEQELMIAMREEVQRMRALINDLLDLSKIESGKMEMEFEAVPVSLCCEKALTPFQRQAEEKSIRLYFEPQPDLPTIRADANKITWVLTNLIGNALRYARTAIRVSVEKVGASVHIAVRDDGPGIPLEYQTRIFDKFVQVKDPQHTGGTGLGLAICKEIVRAHGGTIWVDSVPDHGSTFTFTLPLG